MTDVPVDSGNGKADPLTRPPLLLFVHIPKTAGTAMHSILNVNPVGRPKAQLRGRNVFRGGGGIERSIYDYLRDAEASSFRHYRMIGGHYPLGIRDCLPPALKKRRELQYLTFLRDPVDRMLSHFFAVLGEHGGSPDPSQGKKKLVLSPLAAQASLEDAMAGGYLHDNLHTRMLSGLPEPFGEVTEETLERAKENLRDPRLVFGLTERFDESLVLIKRRLGLRCILSRSDPRINQVRPRGQEVPVELAAAAEESNRYDMELYRYARELFDAESDLSEPDFEAEVASLPAARRQGPIHVEQPPPDGFDGSPELWRERIAGLARAQRLESSVGILRRRLGSAAAITDKLQDDLEEQREAYERQRTRVGDLEARLTALRSASAERIARLEQQIARLEEGDRTAPGAKVKARKGGR
jgi:hypothetical protein